VTAGKFSTIPVEMNQPARHFLLIDRYRSDRLIPRQVKKLVLILSALFLTAASYGQVTFDFDSGTAGTDLKAAASLTASTTSGGITLSVTGFPSGVFNVTASGFGLNADGSGDDTDEFDQNEGFTFSFDTTVTLDSIKVSQFGAGSSGTVAFDGGSSIASISSTGTTSLTSTMVSSGTLLRFTSTGTAAFSVDNLIVTSAVPEPSTYALIFGAATLGFVIYRRRSKRVS